MKKIVTSAVGFEPLILKAGHVNIRYHKLNEKGISAWVSNLSLIGLKIKKLVNQAIGFEPVTLK